MQFALILMTNCFWYHMFSICFSVVIALPSQTGFLFQHFLWPPSSSSRCRSSTCWSPSSSSSSSCSASTTSTGQTCSRSLESISWLQVNISPSLFHLHHVYADDPNKHVDLLSGAYRLRISSRILFFLSRSNGKELLLT